MFWFPIDRPDRRDKRRNLHTIDTPISAIRMAAQAN
tara:strand:+ start:1398 stop:1505 length:108 start_codon:yes stop_codon:yes gene_type:complete